MQPWLKSHGSDAMRDTPGPCCTMSPGRLLTFKGARRTSAAEAPSRPNHLARNHGVSSAVARLPL